MSNSTSFQHYNYSPVIHDDSFGIRIYIPNQLPESSDDSPKLYGAFRLPEEYAKNIENKPHKAIVLVATSGDYVYAKNIFSESIIFSDDLIYEGGVIQGFFNLMIFEYIKSGKGKFNIMVSLGPYISNSELSSV